MEAVTLCTKVGGGGRGGRKAFGVAREALHAGCGGTSSPSSSSSSSSSSAARSSRRSSRDAAGLGGGSARGPASGGRASGGGAVGGGGRGRRKGAVSGPQGGGGSRTSAQTSTNAQALADALSMDFSSSESDGGGRGGTLTAKVGGWRRSGGAAHGNLETQKNETGTDAAAALTQEFPRSGQSGVQADASLPTGGTPFSAASGLPCKQATSEMSCQTSPEKPAARSQSGQGLEADGSCLVGSYGRPVRELHAGGAEPGALSRSVDGGADNARGADQGRCSALGEALARPAGARAPGGGGAVERGCGFHSDGRPKLRDGGSDEWRRPERLSAPAPSDNLTTDSGGMTATAEGAEAVQGRTADPSKGLGKGIAKGPPLPAKGKGKVKGSAAAGASPNDEAEHFDAEGLDGRAAGPRLSGDREAPSPREGRGPSEVDHGTSATGETAEVVQGQGGAAPSGKGKAKGPPPPGKGKVKGPSLPAGLAAASDQGPSELDENGASVSERTDVAAELATGRANVQDSGKGLAKGLPFLGQLIGKGKGQAKGALSSAPADDASRLSAKEAGEAGGGSAADAAPEEGGADGVAVLAAAPGKGKGKAKGPPPPPAKAVSPDGVQAAAVGAEPAPGSDGAEPKAAGGKGKGKKGPPPPPPKAFADAAAAADAAGAEPKADDAKGKGKGKAKGPPPPAGAAVGKAAGKGKGPPPKGGPKAEGKSGFFAKATMAKAKANDKFGMTPFGRRIHWVQPVYDELDGETIFADLAGTTEFDAGLLKAMLSKADETKPSGAGRRKAIVQKPQGIPVLDATRAQNLAIALMKLKLYPRELCECLKHLDFSNPLLSIEDLELLVTVLPTPEESKKLLEHKNILEQLRDVEQKVMPFCTLPRSVGRLRLMRFALSHASLHSGYLERCKTLQLAAEEARSSREFRELLNLVLRVGNFINHGVEEGNEGAKGFDLASLSTLATFKTGAVSTLHFLCLSMRTSDADTDFLRDFKASLEHIKAASREKVHVLTSSIESFKTELEFARRERQALEPGDLGARARMDELVGMLEVEAQELQTHLDKAVQTVVDIQKYFSITEKAVQAPPEQFFGYIASFIDALSMAWLEIEKTPKKWQQFAIAAAVSGEKKLESRKTLPPGKLGVNLSEITGRTHAGTDPGIEPDSCATSVAGNSRAPTPTSSPNATPRTSPTPRMPKAKAGPSSGPNRRRTIGGVGPPAEVLELRAEIAAAALALASAADTSAPTSPGSVVPDAAGAAAKMPEIAQAQLPPTADADAQPPGSASTHSQAQSPSAAPVSTEPATSASTSSSAALPSDLAARPLLVDSSASACATAGASSSGGDLSTTMARGPPELAAPSQQAMPGTLAKAPGQAASDVEKLAAAIAMPSGSSTAPAPEQLATSPTEVLAAAAPELVAAGAAGALCQGTGALPVPAVATVVADPPLATTAAISVESTAAGAPGLVTPTRATRLSRGMLSDADAFAVAAEATRKASAGVMAWLETASVATDDLCQEDEL